MNTIPNKSLGQHWLHHSSVLDAICESADVQPSDVVLEIGPGLGTLTNRLLLRGAHVTAVEFDAQLAANLTQNIVKHGSLDTDALENLTVIESDILKLDFRDLPTDYKVVANIPYYLTSNLIRVLCESTNPFSKAAILIQKEVAERVCASPGQMSMLSVSAQYYCEVQLSIFVPKELFVPPPKVDSQVLELTFRDKPLFEDVDTKEFFRVVRAGFSQKRKTLVNSLSGGLAMEKNDVRIWLKRADIAENTRAQALSLRDWHMLYLKS